MDSSPRNASKPLGGKLNFVDMLRDKMVPVMVICPCTVLELGGFERPRPPQGQKTEGCGKVPKESPDGTC